MAQSRKQGRYDPSWKVSMCQCKVGAGDAKDARFMGGLYGFMG